MDKRQRKSESSWQLTIHWVDHKSSQIKRRRGKPLFVKRSMPRDRRDILRPNTATVSPVVPKDEGRSAAEDAPSAGNDLRFRDVLHGDLAKVFHALRTDPDHVNPVLRLIFAVRHWMEPPHAQMMELPYCTPLPILWAERGDDAGPAATIHKTYLREAWRERKGWNRAKLIATFFTLWPALNLMLMAWSTWLNGSAVKRRTGKGLLRQMREQVLVVARFHILSPWYYTFDLHDNDHYQHAREYVQRFETKGGIYGLFKKYLRGSRDKSPLNNKEKFVEHCHAHGVRTVPVLAIAKTGVIHFSTGHELPNVDLFVKPSVGRGGAGADWWRYAGTDSFVSSGGKSLTRSELRTHIERLSVEQPYLVSPRVSNHPALSDLSNGALSTVRVVTIQDEHGGYEATDAVFRMAVGPNTVIDNFHAGGLAANVERASAELGPATDLGLRPDWGWRKQHPSGATIAGRQLPYWRETIELVQRAHAAFSDRIIIGWDVAVLEDGPCLVEGNGSPDLDIHQRCSRTPVGRTRLGELLAFHTRRALAARDAVADKSA